MTKTILCPKCKGQGITEKPSWIPGDIDSWTSGSTTYACDLCHGAMIIDTDENN